MERFNKKINELFGIKTRIEQQHFQADVEKIKVQDLIDSERRKRDILKFQKLMIKGKKIKN